MKNLKKSEIIRRMKMFGLHFRNLGFALLFIIAVITIISFWTMIYTYYNPYQEIALLALRLTDLSIKISAIGILVYYLFTTIEFYRLKKKFKKWMKYTE